MSGARLARAVCLLAVAFAATSRAHSQQVFDDAAAITQFQRSVDAYAFQHRQVERRLGQGADQPAMAAGMRAARPAAADGDVFTPIVAAAFRNRIAVAFRHGCTLVTPGTPGSEVPRVGALAVATHPVPGCLSGVLPRLPEELEYRAASVALILLDTHANVVVDVLHGALPASPE